MYIDEKHNNDGIRICKSIFIGKIRLTVINTMGMTAQDKHTIINLRRYNWVNVSRFANSVNGMLNRAYIKNGCDAWMSHTRLS